MTGYRSLAAALLAGSLAAASLAGGTAGSLAGEARAADVVIGVPDWSSAKVTAHVLKALLEQEFDVDVALEDGTNESIFAAMDDGTGDIHPEVWLPNHGALNAEYVLRRKSVNMSRKGVPARQGICATRLTRDEHGITSVTDLADPAKVGIFDTDGNGKGEMWIGAADWSSTRIEKIRARSYGYAQTMDLLEAPEEIAVTAIDAAMAAGKPLVFYCYEPHYAFELHDIVFLDEPAYDPRKWTVLTPAQDPDWLEKSDAGVAWPPSFFHINYSTRLAEAHPEVAAYLESIRLDVDTVSEMTYALIVERRDPDDFAAAWISDNSDRVSAWRNGAKQ
ncbi:glycine betaine ABC transporter substrate-binding protein [Microbaculum marinum]|uniref:Glycine betaine ABC transporter substrate-binding protein n=1 Tax=Microbaculum marinum TaxID=1764581 RepID=A0AAW9RRS2_9HYPH